MRKRKIEIRQKAIKIRCAKRRVQRPKLQKQMLLLLVNHQQMLQQMLKAVVLLDEQLAKISDAINGLGRIAAIGHF
jgi:hypothetical protein